MSLKGYKWVDDNEDTIMTYLFKDEILNICKDTTKEELDKFTEYLEKNDCKIRDVNMNTHEVRTKIAGLDSIIEE